MKHTLTILHRIMYGKKLAKEGVEVFYEITETKLKDYLKKYPCSY